MPLNRPHHSPDGLARLRDAGSRTMAAKLPAILEGQRRARERKRPPMPPAPRAVDPAVTLYRAERAARQLRLDPLIDEAKASLARLKADLEQHGKGGRPKKRRSGPGSLRDE